MIRRLQPCIRVLLITEDPTGHPRALVRETVLADVPAEGDVVVPTDSHEEHPVRSVHWSRQHGVAVWVDTTAPASIDENEDREIWWRKRGWTPDPFRPASSPRASGSRPVAVDLKCFVTVQETKLSQRRYELGRRMRLPFLPTCGTWIAVGPGDDELRVVRRRFEPGVAPSLTISASPENAEWLLDRRHLRQMLRDHWRILAMSKLDTTDRDRIQPGQQLRTAAPT